jgi:hypothetical protein
MKAPEVGNGEKWGIFGELSLVGKEWGTGKIALYRRLFPFSLPLPEIHQAWGKFEWR